MAKILSLNTTDLKFLEGIVLDSMCKDGIEVSEDTESEFNREFTKRMRHPEHMMMDLAGKGIEIETENSVPDLHITLTHGVMGNFHVLFADASAKVHRDLVIAFKDYEEKIGQLFISDDTPIMIEMMAERGVALRGEVAVLVEIDQWMSHAIQQVWLDDTAPIPTARGPESAPFIN